MDDSEYFREGERIMREYRSKMAALDIRWAKEQGRVPRKHPSFALNAVVRATNYLPGQFTGTDVIAWLQRNDPVGGRELKSASVRSALKRLCDRGDLEVVQAGRGRKPGRYRKAGEERPADSRSPY